MITFDSQCYLILVAPAHVMLEEGIASVSRCGVPIHRWISNTSSIFLHGGRLFSLNVQGSVVLPKLDILQWAPIQTPIFIQRRLERPPRLSHSTRKMNPSPCTRAGSVPLFRGHGLSWRKRGFRTNMSRSIHTTKNPGEWWHGSA